MSGSTNPGGRSGRKTWALFLALGVAIEVYALASRGRHMSLSEFTRACLGQHPRRPDRPVWGAVLTGVLTWFYGHIVFGWGPSLTEDHRLSFRSIYYAQLPADVVQHLSEDVSDETTRDT